MKHSTLKAGEGSKFRRTRRIYAANCSEDTEGWRTGTGEVLLRHSCCECVDDEWRVEFVTLPAAFGNGTVINGV